MNIIDTLKIMYIWTRFRWLSYIWIL